MSHLSIDCRRNLSSHFQCSHADLKYLLFASELREQWLHSNQDMSWFLMYTYYSLKIIIERYGFKNSRGGFDRLELECSNCMKVKTKNQISNQVLIYYTHSRASTPYTADLEVDPWCTWKVDHCDHLGSPFVWRHGCTVSYTSTKKDREVKLEIIRPYVNGAHERSRTNVQEHWRTQYSQLWKRLLKRGVDFPVYHILLGDLIWTTVYSGVKNVRYVQPLSIKSCRRLHLKCCASLTS